ncbi:hypothetical protein [Petrocella atlantisensis]|nr:hypothetical protein [Petrocella atlantisensis]
MRYMLSFIIYPLLHHAVITYITDLANSAITREDAVATYRHH